jgi:hypothetical protein
LKKIMQPVDIASLPIPPPRPVEKRGGRKLMIAKREEKEDLKIATMGGAASKLLPESVKEDAKDEKSATPLLNDNDARSYAARYGDLKGTAPLTHYATVGVAQGRLGQCAKSLTDYEAQTYLETFPELS